MSKAACHIFAVCLLVVVGCASRSRLTEVPSRPAPATAPSDPLAMLALDEIEPKPQLEKPATAPAGEAPLAALDLYARARDARARNQLFSAINLLEQASRLDPESFEVWFSLGSAYQRAGNFEKAVAAYQRAELIQPDDLVLQAELGRAYMQRGDTTRGIRHLRLARMTSEYSTDDGLAAAVEYRLGVALQQGGYDRAALDMYAAVFRRLQQPSGALRSNPEIAYLLNRPEFLLEQLGRLYEKHGQWDEAMRAYRMVAERQPDDFNAQARVVNMQMSAGHPNEAMRGAVELVTRFRANQESLTLMRDVYRQAGRSEAAVTQLQSLHEQNPNDRTILFALADSLDAAGRTADAVNLLSDAAQRRDGDPEILSRLVNLLAADGNLERAALVLIESAALRPDTTIEILPLWARLVSPGRKPTLHLADIQKLVVPTDAQPAKLYFAARVAEAWNRPSAAEAALRRAVEARPVFPPAFRALADAIWTEPRVDEQQKQQASDQLIAAARAAGAESLATELAGISLLARKKFDEAQRTLAQALQLGGKSPELALTHARALRASGNTQRFEQLTTRLMSDHPQFAPAYSEMFRYQTDRGNISGSRNVLSTWLATMPDDVDARLLEASVELRFNRRLDQTERLLLQVFSQHPDRMDVLTILRAFYTESGKLSVYVDLLEAQRIAHPYNYPAAAQLVDVYLAQERLAEAARVVDAARDALRDDPDRLYFVSHLYSRVNQPALSEQVLEEVLRVDPSYTSAANDLGYTWADAGRNLDRAEALVRRAVESEPANPMFLDSLGWVLYKQGQFDGARRYLEQAVANSRPADPVVLDHLGDALYRLNDSESAAVQWQLSLQRISSSPAREQHNALKLQLEQKLKQLAQKQPVSVAPIAQDVPASGQAKN